jgi:hypothetical protein
LQCPTNGHHLPCTNKDRYSGKTQFSQPLAIQKAKNLFDSTSICFLDRFLFVQKASNLQSRKETEGEKDSTITQKINPDWRVAIVFLLFVCFDGVNVRKELKRPNV